MERWARLLYLKYDTINISEKSFKINYYGGYYGKENQKSNHRF